MGKQLRFTSSKFSPIHGETEKTNLARYGLDLAVLVKEKLINLGYTISEEPIPEDWVRLLLSIEEKGNEKFVEALNQFVAASKNKREIDNN